VVIAHGKNMVFAKHVQVGGDLLNRLVADALKVGVAQAKDMRIRAGRQQAQASRLPAGVVGIGADQHTHPLGRQNAAAGAALAGIDPETAARVGEATAGAVESLIGELQMCVRYYESIFPGRVVDRAIFVGGESRHIAMCQRIAQALGLPATLGDPLARLLKDQATPVGVDVRQPQPGWAIAVGLAIGLAPANVEREAKSA
jgi:Tfp pilus assembly PilM family ATPase